MIILSLKIFENFHKDFKNSDRKMKRKIKFIIKVVVQSNVNGILNSQFLAPKLLVPKFLIDGTEVKTEDLRVRYHINDFEAQQSEHSRFKIQ